MKYLDQIRAAHALEAAQATNNGRFRMVRADVAGFPALIIQNGLLAAFAYASEEGKSTRAGMKHACDCTASHLSSHGIPILSNARNASALIEALSSGHATSLDLQRATSEALQFFAFLKRFAERGQPEAE
jgi:CRISPR/Cas system CMR-associated protein Cmr5 small subunit